METTSNGKHRSSPQKKQKARQDVVYSGTSQGAIMESLDPLLVGNDIEHEMASAANISTKINKNKAQNERHNMNSSTNSFGSLGKLLKIHRYFFIQAVVQTIRPVLSS